MDKQTVAALLEATEATRGLDADGEQIFATPTEATIERVRIRYGHGTTVIAIPEHGNPEPIPKWLADAVLAQAVGQANEIKRLRGELNAMSARNRTLARKLRGRGQNGGQHG